MKTITINLYSFNELSNEAKEKALQNWNENNSYFWSDDAIKSLKKFAEHFNCEVKNYSIDWNNAAKSDVSFSVPEYLQEITKDELKAYIDSMGSYDSETLKGNGDCKFRSFISRF